MYGNFRNYDQWLIQDEECYRTTLGVLRCLQVPNSASLFQIATANETHDAFMRCRSAKVLRLLLDTQRQIREFRDKLSRFQRAPGESFRA